MDALAATASPLVGGPAPIPEDERARLAGLYALDLLDRSGTDRFDRLTRLARAALDVPIALVSLVDAERQWFCSRQGIEALETPRDVAFCAHAIVGSEPTLVVPDARLDVRFADNPLVVGPPNIRFYAGAPISDPTGHRIGTLCVIDDRPREMEADDHATLVDLAALVEDELRHVSLALTDDLTGLANRRAFVEATRRFVSLGNRQGEPLSVVVADVDGLKEVNDAYGHRAGDALLRRAASVLREAAGDGRLVARVGGDEFGILVFGGGRSEADGVIAEIDAALTRHNEIWSGDVPLAISLGAAVADRYESASDIINRADLSMYAAKHRLRAV